MNRREYYKLDPVGSTVRYEVMKLCIVSIGQQCLVALVVTVEICFML